VPIHEVYACGGIASKNDFMMQIYSDVLNKDIRIAASNQTPALGAAIFAAVAAGEERGGYKNIYDAAKAMGKVKDKFFKPIKSNVEAYNKLYAEYRTLHDFFGKGGNDVMKRLKKIKEELNHAG
jgi:L-ribulokinase